MNRALLLCSFLTAAVMLAAPPIAGAADAGYTRLEPIELKILAAATPFPGGYWEAANVLKPATATGQRAEYASHGLGARTFIDFDLGAPRPVAAFRHVQRRGPDTIAAAELIFSDAAGFEPALARVPVQHVDEPGATSFAAFPPVTARYVRWQVTSVLPGRSPNVGGGSIELFAAGSRESKPAGIGIAARTPPIIEKRDDGLAQPLLLTLDSPYAEPVQATVAVAGQSPQPVELAYGSRTLALSIPPADAARKLRAAVAVAGEEVAAQELEIPAARRITVYVLPHSHTDIGYTALQTDIEEKQINNLLQGLADARRTAGYPEGARFIWNVEVLWGADLFLQRLAPERQEEFFAAVKSGQVALHGMYLNELTGLCRPEELLRLFRDAARLGQRCGVTVDAAMISDVPGYTWGTVTAMAHAGVRYFSVAPNYFDRIGDILVQWENKPFWWIGPDGQSRVLVWIPFRGYATSHIYGQMSPQFVDDFCAGLERRGYPYDIAYLRWAGHGDNAVPEPSICEFIRDWNATHVSPRFIISSTSDAFRAFEAKYGDQLPEVRGDWTPYWEDGAGSSAAETAMNRASSDRLVQAETLYALLAPQRMPAGRLADAWNNVLLYSEHTWGAYCSVSEPAHPFTVDQWTIKQSYATAANNQSRQLLSQAAQDGGGFEPAADAEKLARVDIYNTTSWPRTEVVLIPHELSAAGNGVKDDAGRPVPAQRLAGRELAVLVRDLPPFSGRRYTIGPEGQAAVETPATANGHTLDNGLVRVVIDPETGAVAELRAAGIEANLVDSSAGHAVNDYLYLIGDDVKNLQRSGPPKVAVRDGGPLVASLRIESAAPGCHTLIREVRLTAGSDCVELLNTVDKKRLEAKSYHAAEGKESVNFAFPFHVPEGQIRLDAPLAVFRPELDQMPSACKNWLTVGRWADVANPEYGVTWVTLDAPLVQVGGITATLLNSQANPDVWRKRIEPTQALYSWAMNNHWGTNYRAYQEGPVTFRFALRPHRGPCDDAAAGRLATGLSQPLVAVPGRGAAPRGTPLLEVSPADVQVIALKPSDDGRAWIVRLLAAGGKPAEVALKWSEPGPRRVWRSDLAERPLEELGGPLHLPPWGVATVRAER